jgi:hypothetical protein
LCQQHLTAIPDAPSQRLGRAVSAELEHAILACLEKNRAKRPQTARDLATMLDRVADAWSLDDAETWWSRHERGQQPPGSASAGAASPSRSTAATTPPANAGGNANAAPAQAPKTVAPGLDRTTVFESTEDGDR